MRHAILGAIVLVCASASLARAQAFADLKTAAVDYSKSDLTPAVPCENLARFTAPDIATMQARMVPAAGDAPVHCRVSGVLKPEIAFEVNLPMQWNGRFYMIGNGGHAGEGPDDAGRASQRTEAIKLGFVIATTNTGHDASQGAGRQLRPYESRRRRSTTPIAPFISRRRPPRTSRRSSMRSPSRIRTGTRVRTAAARA